MLSLLLLLIRLRLLLLMLRHAGLIHGKSLHGAAGHHEVVLIEIGRCHSRRYDLTVRIAGELLLIVRHYNHEPG